ncbi:hypothetical protein M3Y94_00887700 [Aphelenchoides besseyi]|nr:hypothetical protein M3Y94_00887700 [Aphelenchoides besseyi]
MAKRFENKVVIVTGQAAAYRFAQEGAKGITIHGRNPEAMQETTDKLKENGFSEDRIQQVLGDVKEENTLKELVNKTIEKFGQIDVLVNNAGNSAEEAGLSTADIESLDHILDMNLKSYIKLAAFALPHLEKTKGNIVNVSSVDGVRPHPEAINYSISKAAIDHYTRNAAVLFAEKDIRINNVNPGYIHTQIKPRSGVEPEGLKKFHETWVKRNCPMKRPGESREIANVIAFLASEEASFMTGSIVVADGGLIQKSEDQKPMHLMFLFTAGYNKIDLTKRRRPRAHNRAFRKIYTKRSPCVAVLVANLSLAVILAISIYFLTRQFVKKYVSSRGYFRLPGLQELQRYFDVQDEVIKDHYNNTIAINMCPYEATNMAAFDDAPAVDKDTLKKSMNTIVLANQLIIKCPHCQRLTRSFRFDDNSTDCYVKLGTEAHGWPAHFEYCENVGYVGECEESDQWLHLPSA